MENQNVKRGRGRPPKYSTEEERKDALRRQKSKYMLDKEWYCDICKTGRNYTLAGKHCHLKTIKHRKNSTASISWRKIIDIMQGHNA